MEELINKIHQADCLEFMKQLPDKCIDLVLTDPPYGIGISNKKSIGGAVGKHNKVNSYNVSDWDNIRFTAKQFNELKRISKNQIIFGYNYFADFLGNTNSLIIWDKKCKNGWEDTFSDGEIGYTSFKQPLRIFRYLYQGCTGNNEITRGERIHPTQKPVQLFQWCLDKYSKPNDLILDCFSGSGTTAIACHKENRRFICVEKDSEYVRLSRERLEKERQQLNLFD